MTQDSTKPKRTGKSLSLSPLEVSDALRGALNTPLPGRKPKKARKATKKRAKRKKKARK